jgi:hypothetical protein
MVWRRRLLKQLGWVTLYSPFFFTITAFGFNRLQHLVGYCSTCACVVPLISVVLHLRISFSFDFIVMYVLYLRLTSQTRFSHSHSCPTLATPRIILSLLNLKFYYYYARMFLLWAHFNCLLLLQCLVSISRMADVDRGIWRRILCFYFYFEN